MTTEPKLLSASGKTQLIRPRYSAGLMLQDDDLTQAVDYARDLNRLMFRSLLGCGVVCGLKVTLHKQGSCKSIHISSGLALNACGDPIHVATDQFIPLVSDCGNTIADTLWVVIRRTDHFCMPRDVACSPDEDAGDTVYTRLRHGFEILLEKGATARTDACGCSKPEDAKECYKTHNAAECECNCDCSWEWVVLGVVKNILTFEGTEKDADHRVRRFIRPMLMDDPVREKSQATAQSETKKPEATEAAHLEALAELNASLERQAALSKKITKTRETLNEAGITEAAIKDLEDILNASTIALQEEMEVGAKTTRAMLEPGAKPN